MLSGWTCTSILSRRQVEEPVGLDDLQPLVHQGGRIDGDLLAHVPGRMSQGVGRGDQLESAAVRSRNGPPEAVRINPADIVLRWPARDWKIAECSLSTGKSWTPWRATALITSSPAITSVSLLARATSIPASMAASVGSRPAAPTMAETTICAPLSAAQATNPSRPERMRGALFQQDRETLGIGGRGNGDQFRAESADLLLEQRQIAPGGKCHHAETLRVGGDDLQRADTDGTGGTEDRERFHRSLHETRSEKRLILDSDFIILRTTSHSSRWRGRRRAGCRAGRAGRRGRGRASPHP